MKNYSPLLLLLLAACAAGSNLEALRAKNPAGKNFNQVLAAEYLGYAESLSEEGHPIRTSRFAQKGLDAISGYDVAPEESDTLAEQRKALLASLTPDVKEVAPAKAARAQLQFDCWADGKALCEEGFNDALAEIEFIADLLVHDDDNRFKVEFDGSKSRLSEKANTVLDVIAKRVATYGEYQVELMAYGNKTKSSSKIKALASNRILAIEKALIARGVDAGRIHKHRSTHGSEVFLSVDEADDSQNAVAISIQTFRQVPEVKSP